MSAEFLCSVLENIQLFCSNLLQKWIKLPNFSIGLDIGPNPWTARVVVIMH